MGKSVSKSAGKKLWGGRFEGKPEEKAFAWASSIAVDKRLYKEDIAGSVAHAKMLARQKIISKKEAGKICSALKAIEKDIEEGKLIFTYETEDIHMSIETELTKRLGNIGKKLHTARSRNDQIATDLRLYQKREIKNIDKLLQQAIKTLRGLAKENMRTIMPGLTHLQHAQPITLAAYLRAYAEMLSRDRSRLADCLKRTDLSPLGSGALFGVNHPVDRGWVARELGFRSVTANPLDAVSDRDFAIELLSCISLIMTHLSRFAEEYIIFASQEFSYLEPADGYSTGSSIMPQKKNPDMAELIRGKSGRAFGNLVTLLTIMKGLPLAYNKDMQEDKEPYFDSIDTVKSCLDIFSGMLAATKFNKAEMRKKTKLGFMNATDAADYLASRGVPFREAHRIVGELVLHAIKKGKALEDLSLEEYKKFSGVFDEKIFDAISYEKSVTMKTL